MTVASPIGVTCQNNLYGHTDRSRLVHTSDPPRVIIVTGATSGIGRAAAVALARREWHVIASGRDAERGDAVAAEISSVGNGEFIAADLSKLDEPERLVAEVVRRHQRLDGLVNDAGIHTLADTVETRPEDWDAILGVNLRAVFLLCRAAIPVMARSGGGVIVNVASEAGLAAIPRQVAYNVSKAGMLMLTRSIAVDHATQGIRAVSVCPGATMTPLVREAIKSAPDPEAHERSLALSRPARRLGTVDEIATAIALVASPELEFMTGSELVIDGGFTAT